MRQLTTYPGDDLHPAWSPDGERLAYTSVRDGNWDIWVVPALGGEPQRLTEQEREDNFATWSPDGRWIAYYSRADGRQDIWRVLATGSEPERLTENYARLPRWAPDGEKIYFRKRTDLWELTLADGSERLVADFSGKFGSQGLTALDNDGEYLYFTWEELLGDVWAMDVVWHE